MIIPRIQTRFEKQTYALVCRPVKEKGDEQRGPVYSGSATNLSCARFTYARDLGPRNVLSVVPHASKQKTIM